MKNIDDSAQKITDIIGVIDEDFAFGAASGKPVVINESGHPNWASGREGEPIHEVVDEEQHLHRFLFVGAEIVIGSNTNCDIDCPSVDPIFDGISCFDEADCPGNTTCGRDGLHAGAGQHDDPVVIVVRHALLPRYAIIAAAAQKKTPGPKPGRPHRGALRWISRKIHEEGAGRAR